MLNGFRCPASAGTTPFLAACGGGDRPSTTPAVAVAVALSTCTGPTTAPVP
jgi:hypothetical protein